MPNHIFRDLNIVIDLPIVDLEDVTDKRRKNRSRSSLRAYWRWLLALRHSNDGQSSRRQKGFGEKEETPYGTILGPMSG